jgi:hypothetical protein
MKRKFEEKLDDGNADDADDTDDADTGFGRLGTR